MRSIYITKTNIEFCELLTNIYNMNKDKKTRPVYNLANRLKMAGIHQIPAKIDDIVTMCLFLKIDFIINVSQLEIRFSILK